MDPGINKPFDRIAKEFAEEAPMVFLRLLGLAPQGSTVALEPLRAETAPHVVMPDYVGLLSIDSQDPSILHVEFFLRYRKDIPGIMARYGGSLAGQYQRPVESLLVLFRKEGVPDAVPETGEHAIGKTRILHEFRTVRLWELDPAPVLTAGDPGLLPWALLMNLGREEAARLGAEIARTGSERWIARFLTLGALRYPREELMQMLGGPRMGLVEVIIEGSRLVQEEFAEARGRAAEARRLLKLALAKRFPGLETMPELETISSVTVLESLLLDHAMRDPDRDSLEQAILAARHRT